MDSRASSILLNLDLSMDPSKISSIYTTSTEQIIETEKSNKKKSYDSLKSMVKECYLTGSLRYGNNFIM